jgi:hypothetical protein
MTTRSGCEHCSGDGQFCDYPYCMGEPRPAPPDPEADRKLALEWANSWTERHAVWLQQNVER